MSYRLVTTGKDSDGKSVILSDDQVEPISVSFLPGVEFFRFGGGDEPPDLLRGRTAPISEVFFPPTGGYRFLLTTIPPGVVQAPENLDKREALSEMETKLPGLLAASEQEPGMHTSRTVDFVLILEGEVSLELDDGAMIELDPGNFVLQVGARHRWSNRGTTRAAILSTIIGAS